MHSIKKQPKIFYGWYILAVSMLGAFLASGTSQLFMSIMLKPLTEEFGWSRSAATGAVTTGTLMAGLLSLPFGKLVDRYGTRLLTSLGAVIVAGAYIGITRSVDLWHFYCVYVIARVVSTNAISSIAPKTAVVNWFRRFRGRALGFLAMSVPLGSSVLAMAAQFIMVHHGWRTVFMVFALAMVSLQAIPAALILRRRPEDMGLVPDGKPCIQATATPLVQNPPAEEPAWNLDEAIRTPTLWFLITGMMVALTVNAGVGFHLVAYCTDVGIDTTVAVGAMSVYAMTGAISSVFWGVLSERLPERLLAAAIMILTAAAILFLQSVTTPTAAFLFAVLFGLTSRGEGALVNIILAQYYGRRSYGTISGFVFPFNMVGLGFGPLISSISFDLSGSYHSVLNVYIAVSIAASVLFWFAKKPRPSIRTSSRLHAG